MNQFDSLRLALFSGKGGVGKTTLSCGFARRWAHQFPSETVLLLSTDPAHSLGDVLQCAVESDPKPVPDLPNLQVQALDAEQLLREFKAQYGDVLQLLVERGSFVEGADLQPVWDLSWPGLDELMGLLEIQRLRRSGQVDRIVVDMAPSGHTLNLLGLMDFLDEFLQALDLFQEKHRAMSRALAGQHSDDDADQFLVDMRQQLQDGRKMLQDSQQTGCWIVAIAERMSLLESQRLLSSLGDLKIPIAGLFVNHLVPSTDASRYRDQQFLKQQFLRLGCPVFAVPEVDQEPIGGAALDQLLQQVAIAESVDLSDSSVPENMDLPDPIPPGLSDFLADGRRLVIVGGKGGVGKTTVAAAIAWDLAKQHPDQTVRVISIDPAHSLGDALGQELGHTPSSIAPNLSAQEIDADEVLNEFREEYLWELAEMMSGDASDETIKIAYGPDAWKQIVSQALPGIDEMLSLIAIMELLEEGSQDIVVLDTAPTGHLLRFLEMPTALTDWLSWIFKLWLKYQDVAGHTELMGRLRTLRKRVVQAQKALKDSSYTEFVAVLQARTAIAAETQRLIRSLQTLGIAQRYVVENRHRPGHAFSFESPEGEHPEALPTIVKLPELPAGLPAAQQTAIAAQLLMQPDS